jgi:16S rRNA G966 N2-methylase RsmD
MVLINKKSYRPSTDDVKDQCYELFGQGDKGLEGNESMEEG